MKITNKIRIFPNEKQEELLWGLSEKCRLAYNFSLTDRKNNHDFNLFIKDYNICDKEKYYIPTKTLTFFDQQKSLAKLRNEVYLEYQWVLERVLSMTLKKLDANYKSFYTLWKNGHLDARPPRYLGRNYFVTLNFNRSGFTKNSYKQIKFSHKHPDYDKNLLTFEIPKKARFIMKKCIEGKIKQVEIKKEDDKWFILVCNEIEVPKYEDNLKYQAIDLGITDIVTAVNLDGKIIHIKNKIQSLEQYWEPKINELKAKRDHCKHPSKKHPNFKKSRRYVYYDNKLKKMIRKRANQNKYFQHVLSDKLVKNTKANTIIIGDLNVKQMGKKKKGTGVGHKTKANKTLNRRILSGSLGRFTEFLTYKAERIGKRVIKIDESNTSKVCCICGSKKKMSLDKREYICDECGNMMNRDENSARNILARFLLTRNNYDFISQNASLQGYDFLSQYSGISTHQGNFG